MEATNGNVPVRGVLFISHATPEENPFATWLAAQLVSAGYEVWCDVTGLLGGERFWRNIEEVIDQHAFRVLFVSTLLTTTKPGCQRELRLALEAQEKLGIKDFIVPIKLDDFPFASMDKRISDLNFMRFDQGWASGFRRLLELLEREGAPRSPSATPACVTEWHRRSLDTRRRVQPGDEAAYSNWFRVKRQPEELWFHDLGCAGSKLAQAVQELARPYRLHSDKLMTFANAAEIQLALGPLVSVRASMAFNTRQFVGDGCETLGIAAFDASNMVTDLLMQAWNGAMAAKGLCSFDMASGLVAWFFENEALPKNRGHFLPPRGGKQTFRQLVGEKSKRTIDGVKVRDGYWHFAISASPQLHPFPRLVLRYHVIFSDDGKTPWSSAERMHRARRSVCKQWWNAEWRDRLLATCAALAGGMLQLHLPAAENAGFDVDLKPMTFTAPYRFFEDNERGLDEAREIELVEDAEEGDDNDDA
ncbi:toll/interleukin-1 receptor domain-containing protein [Bosea sp. 117]|uniref:toll/interleukin-1 receptor domain-containing protein n=1 Tax=Bosea sp. 117 TaxID=1125973 RepID=UPI0018CC7A63|nr:toll/interleukin-1 receptor domain-containing protein [Bosea sp. 117]